MARVILVRHGHPLVEGEDPRQWRLSDQGREAASVLSKASIWEPVSKIYSSPEAKARETAQVVAEEWDIPVKIMEDLGEVRRPYEATDYEDRIRAFLKGETRAGWETREAAEERIRRAMAEISKSAVEVGVVSHGLLLALFVAGVMGGGAHVLAPPLHRLCRGCPPRPGDVGPAAGLSCGIGQARSMISMVTPSGSWTNA